MPRMNNEPPDLALLPWLRLLLEERNVTRAAERAGTSQPSMSRALARLRRMFGDALLVRGPSGLVPTARAEALASALPSVLGEVERLVRPPLFDPATAAERFVIVTADYVSFAFLPALLRRLRREAPSIELDIRNAPDMEIADALAKGAVDLAIGVDIAGSRGLYRQRLFDDDFACLLRRGHPRAKRPLSLADYLALPHAMVTLTGRGAGRVDAALERMGRARTVALRVQPFLAAPWVIAETDLAVTLPRLLAERVGPLAGLGVFDVPLDLGTITVAQVWHERRHRDPAHVWLRELVAETARPLARRTLAGAATKAVRSPAGRRLPTG